MTQLELAELADVSANYICLLEKGNRRPSLDLINCFAKIFKISAKKLIQDDPMIVALYRLLDEYKAEDLLRELQKLVK